MTKLDGKLFRIVSPFRTEQRYWQESSNENEFNKISIHQSEIDLDNYNFDYIIKNDLNQLSINNILSKI
jgi:hypothetical protein